jgi:hypothetical protein
VKVTATAALPEAGRPWLPVTVTMTPSSEWSLPLGAAIPVRVSRMRARVTHAKAPGAVGAPRRY